MFPTVILLSFSFASLYHIVQPSGGVSKGEIFPIIIPAKNFGNKSTSSTSLSPPPQREKKIKVRAPTDLDEGFIFTVRVKGGNITAPVPKGGVRKGEIFYIPTTN